MGLFYTASTLLKYISNSIYPLTVSQYFNCTPKLLEDYQFHKEYTNLRFACPSTSIGRNQAGARMHSLQSLCLEHLHHKLELLKLQPIAGLTFLHSLFAILFSLSTPTLTVLFPSLLFSFARALLQTTFLPFQYALHLFAFLHNTAKPLHLSSIYLSMASHARLLLPLTISKPPFPEFSPS